jgi:NADH-quinone oxidoreductase chain I
MGGRSMAWPPGGADPPTTCDAGRAQLDLLRPDEHTDRARLVEGALHGRKDLRGRHRLHLHENGLEKCVGCSLCAAACPADCIRVVAAENTPDNRVSPGERYARIYEINMSRCIFCGYCELACPFDAITLGNQFELSEYSRDDLIYTKDMLLTEPIKRVPVQDPGLFDTPIPAYKTTS